MITIKTVEDYEQALRRIAQLKARPIVDAPDATELVGLLAAVEEWEADSEISPLERVKPNDFES